MGFLWVIAFVVFFLFLAQLISRLPGENFAGLRKILPPTASEKTNTPIPEDTFARMTNDAVPFFDNLLLLEEKSPQMLLASWKMDDKYYADMLAKYHQENVDMGKAVLRLSYSGGRRVYEDYPVRLSDSQMEILINAPSSTVSAELGFFTAEHHFIPLLHSPSVTIAS